MAKTWKTRTLRSVAEALAVLTTLPRGGWLYRGQSKDYGSLVPSIDRPPVAKLARREKLLLERRSIETLRSCVDSFAPGEEMARHDDPVALMVLRHHGVPTRLLDWSGSPYVATYFAVAAHDASRGEIWAFDSRRYQARGERQWRDHPETTWDGSGDPDKWEPRTAFSESFPANWFICAFYPNGFPRQEAQEGHYTMTAQFGTDHSASIARLVDSAARERFVILPPLKKPLRRVLRDDYGIWPGSLFPDSDGAAEIALSVFGLERGIRRL
jgi:hypothetical protein